MRKRIFVIIISLFTALSSTSCSKIYVTQTEFALDTFCTITIYDPSSKLLLKNCFDLIDELEKLLSRTVKDSDVSRINSSNGIPVTVDSRTASLLREALTYSKLSNGAFDVTVGAESSLWDFESGKDEIPPADALLEAAASADYRSVVVDGNTVTLKNPNAKIDLGGIAKGYIADQVAALIKADGKSAIINLGGNVVTVGKKKDGRLWSIGIQKPFSAQGETACTIERPESAAVTAGIYQRYFEKNGIIYHHILDVKTGIPVNTDLASATVICADSAKADALSTVCVILGREKARSFVESLPDTQAVFIDRSGSISSTEGISPRI